MVALQVKVGKVASFVGNIRGFIFHPYNTSVTSIVRFDNFVFFVGGCRTRTKLEHMEWHYYPRNFNNKFTPSKFSTRTLRRLMKLLLCSNYPLSLHTDILVLPRNAQEYDAVVCVRTVLFPALPVHYNRYLCVVRTLHKPHPHHTVAMGTNH